MSLRTAIREAPWLTAYTLAITGWLVLVAVEVFNSMGSVLNPAGEFVGEAPTSGFVGLVVMIVFLAVLLVTIAELGHLTPAPSPWPPDE